MNKTLNPHRLHVCSSAADPDLMSLWRACTKTTFFLFSTGQTMKCGTYHTIYFHAPSEVHADMCVLNLPSWTRGRLDWSISSSAITVPVLSLPHGHTEEPDTTQGRLEAVNQQNRRDSSHLSPVCDIGALK